MRGKHHIIIETENLKFEFEIKRKDFYTSPQASGLIMKVMPEEIRDILLGVSSRI